MRNFVVGRLKLFGELSPSVATIDEDPSLQLLFQPLFRKLYNREVGCTSKTPYFLDSSIMHKAVTSCKKLKRPIKS